MRAWRNLVTAAGKCVSGPLERSTTRRQHIINEEAERRLLPAYTYGLRGVVRQQVQFQMPSTMEQAMKLAVTVENVERYKQLTEGPGESPLPPERR
jgi:hypothetical protein